MPCHRRIPFGGVDSPWDLHGIGCHYGRAAPVTGEPELVRDAGVGNDKVG